MPREIASDRLASSEGKLVDEITRKPVRQMIGREAVLVAQIEGVLNLPDISRSSGAVLRESLAPRVGAFELESAAHPFLSGNQQRIVVGGAAVGKPEHTAPFRKRQPRLQSTGSRFHCIVVKRAFKVGSLGTQVLRLQDNRLADFLGQTKAPLLRVAVQPLILRTCQNTEDRAGQVAIRIVCVARVGERRRPYIRGISGPELRRRTGHRVLHQIHQLRARIKPTVSAAHDGSSPAEGTISKPEPWRKVVHVGFEQSLPVKIPEGKVRPDVLIERFRIRVLLRKP